MTTEHTSVVETPHAQDGLDKYRSRPDLKEYLDNIGQGVLPHIAAARRNQQQRKQLPYPRAEHILCRFWERAAAVWSRHRGVLEFDTRL